MANREDHEAIEGLFNRIEDVARNSAPRDRDAEALIQQRLRDYPPAPYYMAQTILMQEQALREARARIEELEGGGQRDGWGAEQRQPARARGPWDRDEGNDRRGGGGFLAGAAQTALGVTGGMLLGSAIAGMFAGGAQAEELQPVDNGEQDAPDDFDGGDDMGDGGFDFGGDF
ncbi:MAG: DUF2076 family protein [Candidatus Devosia phytovorans]|uniref:DUF2076 family protein n=1 Tax=Candidatus Devosia phytovorans TaxID=3121372 RepID=A0AAJ5VXY5_9HYPH|nr:DUF2076 family protein [Devosia sp.]WEK06076.1 MAG: DUF2076 family protein [Devosia sp.]